MLKPQHRQYAETVRLAQPIAAYCWESDKVSGSNGAIEWDANLVAIYQKTFYGGEYALTRAWQEIPNSIIVGLADTVRTRVLQFALELKDEMGDSADSPAKVPQEKIEQNVTYNIFGGTNVIAGEAREFEVTSSVVVTKNDISSLQNAMSTIGIGPDDFATLTQALKDDNTQSGGNIGGKTAGWLASIGKTVGREGLKVTSDVAKAAALGWIKQHIGLA